MSAKHDPRPIGVFDSGIGGLTVLRELAQQFPDESFYYLGDTARLPYGTKSSDTIFKYSEQNLKFLVGLGVKACVIACNSASSHFTADHIQDIPVLNVIDPGAEAALNSTQSGRIGILGTRATILSESYPKKILAKNPDAQVFGQACPLFVPLAEEGWAEDPLTNLIAYRYLQPLLQNDIDTLILGCTHYPILKVAIVKVTGSRVTLVDSGEATAHLLKKYFEKNHVMPAASDNNRRLEIMTTDISEHTISLSKKILSGLDVSSFKQVDL